MTRAATMTQASAFRKWMEWGRPGRVAMSKGAGGVGMSKGNERLLLCVARPPFSYSEPPRVYGVMYR